MTVILYIPFDTGPLLISDRLNTINKNRITSPGLWGERESISEKHLKYF